MQLLQLLPCRRFLYLAVAISAVLSSSADTASGQITLEALQRDGYGFVPIKRPKPNVLTVTAEINGRKLRLIIDTGWGKDGISVQSTHLQAMRVGTEEVKEFGTAATGAKLTNFKLGRADRVVIGNVELAGVPLYFGHVRPLTDEQTRRSVGADGFLGEGFLHTTSAVLDLHNLRLYLRPPGKGRRAVLGPAMQASGLAEVPFSRGCLVDAEVNGVEGKMAVDTGAYLSGIDNRLAPKLKTAAYNTRTGTIDAAGVISRTQLANLRSLKIGGVPVRAPDIRLSKYGFYTETGGRMIGILGMDILGRNGSIVDFGSHKMYFYPAQ